MLNNLKADEQPLDRSLSVIWPAVTFPEKAGYNPAINFNRVDLPEPEGPMSSVKPPLTNEMDKSVSVGFDGSSPVVYENERWSTETVAIIKPHF